MHGSKLQFDKLLTVHASLTWSAEVLCYNTDTAMQSSKPCHNIITVCGYRLPEAGASTEH